VTTRLPIPALALLGLQLGAACHHEDPIVGHWNLDTLEGQPKPDGLEMSMDIDADLDGTLDYTLAFGEMYEYDYHATIKVTADGSASYTVDILPGKDITGGQMRCELADDTLTCNDQGELYGNPVFKRG